MSNPKSTEVGFNIKKAEKPTRNTLRNSKKYFTHFKKIPNGLIHRIFGVITFVYIHNPKRDKLHLKKVVRFLSYSAITAWFCSTLCS